MDQISFLPVRSETKNIFVPIRLFNPNCWRMSDANSRATLRAPSSSSEPRYTFPNACAPAMLFWVTLYSQPNSTSWLSRTPVYPNASHCALTGGEDQSVSQGPRAPAAGG